MFQILDYCEAWPALVISQDTVNLFKNQGQVIYRSLILPFPQWKWSGEIVTEQIFVSYLIAFAALIVSYFNNRVILICYLVSMY